LLLGASGLLGKTFVHEFSRHAVSAVCLDRQGCDVNDAVQVRSVFDRVAPKIVINCTAYTKVDLAEKEREQAFAINAAAVGNIAEVCKKHRARLVHFSTDFVFDGSAREPYQPSDLTNALSAYGQSKLEGERLLRQIDPAGWMIARTSWLYGITGPCFPKTILDRAKKGQPLTIVSDQVGSPTYAPDLAAATLDLLGKDASGVHHLTNSGQCSWFEFARAIVSQFGIDADIQPITTAQFREMRPEQAMRPAYSVMVDPEVPALLGHPMRPWQDALASYDADWTNLYGVGERLRRLQPRGSGTSGH
jgi:dTDP-4-dehydrorhamnose reductase